jgi:hypothetical protein
MQKTIWYIYDIVVICGGERERDRKEENERELIYMRIQCIITNSPTHTATTTTNHQKPLV